MKFVQRVILVQTRGISDPRVCILCSGLNWLCFNFCYQLLNKNDPSISSCPGEHPFISVAKLEAEGQKLLEGLSNILYTSQWVACCIKIYHPRYIFGHRDVNLLSAMLNAWVTLIKQRPSTLPYLINALRAWTPVALTGLPASSIKSVEKAVRIVLTHILRCVVITFILQHTKQLTPLQTSNRQSVHWTD